MSKGLKHAEDWTEEQTEAVTHVINNVEGALLYQLHASGLSKDDSCPECVMHNVLLNLIEKLEQGMEFDIHTSLAVSWAEKEKDSASIN